jgi:hypothetical protein
MWGVESLSDAVLRAVGKGTSVDAVMATLEAARAARLELRLSRGGAAR